MSDLQDKVLELLTKDITSVERIFNILSIQGVVKAKGKSDFVNDLKNFGFDIQNDQVLL
jgi:hypothetical protein